MTAAAPSTQGNNRRRILLATLGLAASPLRAVGAPTAPLKAVTFDAFPIFNPSAVFAAGAVAYPETGDDFWRVWFQSTFADTWLRTSAHQYRAFIDIAAARLDYACRTAKLTSNPSARDQILGAFANLTAWPDVKDQLLGLQARGLRLAILSNLSETTLRANLRKNGLDGLFETVLSTDRARAFKPAPEAYALATTALNLRKREVGFAAFAPWDAAGACWFGYPTAWVNRQGQPAEPDAPAVLEGRDLSIVAQLARLSGQPDGARRTALPRYQSMQPNAEPP